METQSYSEQVAGEVRAAIARANLTQSAVCATTGIKGATMSRKLSGKVAFDVDELSLIADALGLVVFELMPRTRPAAQQTHLEAVAS
ncbi:helix-turn-helix transcriptional regulator [Curtobacterium sp. Csp1]|uniref:helix-turn-helix domain-containing protein n=1 Tax=unclassified Curtobacterium TaxID=257496 RepID=UPI0015988F58|nr:MULTISPECIES: helix-turn-helix transcriptional regulator [unclassified Curtobacterium]QKS13913.1 helix-turn-helix transcriptional regulator [Curtobacterium sp. csp3]QKS20956.1 helix-turn-helix transcriptional regulator [Curtobacterium sp. Csp1]